MKMESSNKTLQTAGKDPGGRVPAPGSLRLVQALVNTLNAEIGQDLLGTEAEATRWLTAAGLLPDQPASAAELTAAEHAALVNVREAVRGVLSANTSRREDPAAASRLTLALASCRLGVTIEPGGTVALVSADHDRFARIAGTVAIAIAEAAAAGTWTRLKSCPGELCGWAFYDRSAAGRSVWCSMQLCGARAKMRAYRSRQDS
jgi:predicted RNA-binding Zn ribbon-like protein